MNRSLVLTASLSAVLVMSAAACGSADDTSSADAVNSAPDTSAASTVAVDADATEPTTQPVETSDPALTEPGAEIDSGSSETSSFEIEVWADNWMAVYVDGELIGEDSVPITTERSFNAETFTFDASLPFTIAVEAKDFKETDSGIEYIGEGNQQMGDGGIIAQVTDLATGEVVAGTDAGWSALVVHQAPLNTECVRDADPDSTCEFLILDTPVDWADPGFDDSAWANATEWSAADVSPKDGYDEIMWDPSARLIWGSDLEVDNTVLLRTTVS